MTNKIVAGVGVAVALVVAGAGCGSSGTNTNGSASVQSQTLTAETMVGNWKGVDGTGAEKMTFKGDGTYSSVDREGKPFSAGTWKLDNGTLTMEASDYVGGGTIVNLSFDGKTLKGHDNDTDLDQVWEKQ